MPDSFDPADLPPTSPDADPEPGSDPRHSDPVTHPITNAEPAASDRLADYDGQSVTAVISHLIRPGREQGYEAWLQGIAQASRQFPGHQGVTVLRPRSPNLPEYVVILRFDNYPHLCGWLKSAVRQEWIDRVRPLIQKPENVQVLTGLESLVTLPGQATAPPPRYKTAVITWLGVFLCSTVVSRLVGPWLTGLPILLAQAISIAIVVLLLAYGVMPHLTRLFYGWLHASR